jgi:glycosyltransferase involved in cell wall biosynthesis
MKKLRSLSVFLPCYNEEKNIPLLLKELELLLPKIAKKYEVIVIDDGSADATPKVLGRLKKKYSHLTVITHEKNRGYGAALRSGIEAAQFDWIFFTDGDMQFDVNELTTFVPFADQYEVVIGYRKNRAEGALRQFNAWVFKVFIDVLFRLHVKDIDCAFKLMKANKLKSLPLVSTGAFTSSEFLYRLKKKRVKFKQLPVTHYPRKFGTPTGNNIGVIAKAGWEAIGLYLQIKLQAFINAV